MTLLKQRNVDMVFCIDASGDMRAYMHKVNASLKNLYEQMVDLFEKDLNSEVLNLNARVITFRDFNDTYYPAIVQSKWFDMSVEEFDFEQYIDAIQPVGGDCIESGLEALYYAMTTDWKSTNGNDRQFIVLITNADAHPISLYDSKRIPNYPTDMAADEAEFISTWMCVPPKTLAQSTFRLKERCKRLIMIAPQGTKYEEMNAKLNRSAFVPFEDAIKEGVTLNWLLRQLF